MSQGYMKEIFQSGLDKRWLDQAKVPDGRDEEAKLAYKNTYVVSKEMTRYSLGSIVQFGMTLFAFDFHTGIS